MQALLRTCRRLHKLPQLYFVHVCANQFYNLKLACFVFFLFFVLRKVSASTAAKVGSMRPRPPQHPPPVDKQAAANRQSNQATLAIQSCAVGRRTLQMDSRAISFVCAEYQISRLSLHKKLLSKRCRLSPRQSRKSRSRHLIKYATFITFFVCWHLGSRWRQANF
jgi:hypothetical protein